MIVIGGGLGGSQLAGLVLVIALAVAAGPQGDRYRPELRRLSAPDGGARRSGRMTPVEEGKEAGEPPGAKLADLVEAGKRGTVLRAHVEPGAAREGLAGVHGRSLKVRVRAPAVSGKANEAVLRLLAQELGVAACGLMLTSGVTSREKRVRFDSLSPAELCERLASALARNAASGRA